MTVHRRSKWYESELDSEHIWYRGFDIHISDGVITVGDDDAAPMSRLVMCSAWGSAERSANRDAFPFDFTPVVLRGTEYLHAQALSLPNDVRTLVEGDQVRGRGAWASWEHPVEFTDALEVVLGLSPVGDLPATLVVGQIVFDLSISAVDPFTVAASRILEPLLKELRESLWALDQRAEQSAQLSAQIERLEVGLRTAGSEPSRLRGIVRAALSAIGAIALGIAANRIDDAVHWANVWTAVNDALRRLGL